MKIHWILLVHLSLVAGFGTKIYKRIPYHLRDSKEPLEKDDNEWLKTLSSTWPLQPGEIEQSGKPKVTRNARDSIINLQMILSLLRIQEEDQPREIIENKTAIAEPDLELVDLGKWVNDLRQGIEERAREDPASLTQSAEFILKQTTNRIENLINDASSAVSPKNINMLVARATQGDIGQAANQIALANGLNVTDAASRAKETSEYAANLVQVANTVIRNGYTYTKGDSETQLRDNESNRPLFAGFESVTQVSKFTKRVKMASLMGFLSGAIYEDTKKRLHIIEHSLVAKGYIRDVLWMVTDSLASTTDFRASEEDSPILVRTITIRGFDASDDQVDREELLNTVCSAVPMKIKSNVLAHSGLWGICQDLYDEIDQYLEWCAPNHRIVLNGHSIGGSLANLLLYKIVKERGLDFAKKQILRVYTFGSPPVVRLEKRSGKTVLEHFGLKDDTVHGFVQPWDPIVRLFSGIDSLYPLIGDLGDDGVTPWVNGPPRTLRSITRSIFLAWEGWPLFRDTFKGTGLQNYTSVGIQHLLMPDETRYIADRFAAVNIGVPPTDTILKISSDELLPALDACFPLDTFEISLIPQAIRSFVHHFYPAYGYPLVEHVKALEKKKDSMLDAMEVSFEEREEAVDSKDSSRPSTNLWEWERATQWLQDLSP